MGGVYRRKQKLWLWYIGADGKRIYQATTCRPGEEERAKKILAVVERRVAAEQKTGEHGGPLTLQAYGERWLKGRPAQGVVTHEHEAQRLRLHVWPLLGDVLLKELRPHHVRDMVRALKVKETSRGARKGKPLAPRTVRHVYGSLHTLLHDAVVDELLAANPCVLKRGELPPKVDADPEWRDNAVFNREEVEALISDERIPEDRREWNALQFHAACRVGEAAALRWRHFDPTQEPLGRLTVARSWNHDAKTEGSTKTERTRHMPVHPALAKVLAAWKLNGWHRYFGRAPKPDDLISPNRNGEHRDTRRALKFFHADCEAVSLRVRRQHDSKRTFTSLARGDGARPDVVHWAVWGPTGSIMDAYTTMPWSSLCGEIAKLKVELREGATVLELKAKRAVGAEVCDTACDTRTPGKKKPPSLIDLEAISSTRSRGLEPLTSGVTGRRSNQLN